MPTNDDAVPAHDCPGIRIHAIDIVHPPAIGIPPIADIELQQTIVTAVLAANSDTATPRNARSEFPELASVILQY
jgi:hypothetical protein